MRSNMNVKSGSVLVTVLTLLHFWFHNVVTSTSWLVSTESGACSYQCLCFNFTLISLYMLKCSWAHTLSCLFLYGSFVSIGRSDMKCSSVSSNFLQGLHCYLFRFVIFLLHLVCNAWSCAAIISLSLSSPPNVSTLSWWGACVPQWSYGLCRRERMFLIGPPKPDRP